MVAGDNVIAPYGVFRTAERKTALDIKVPAGSSANFKLDMTTVAGGTNKIVTFESLDDAKRYRDTYAYNPD